MKKYPIKKRILIIFSWLLVFLCMGVIFYLSNQVAEESSALSTSVLSRITAMFGEIFGETVLRKLTHAAEYFGLALLVFNAMYQTCGRARPVVVVLISAAYAVSDEVHQYFVPGRACRVFDLCVDSAGIILSVLLCLLITQIIIHNKERKSL